MPAKGAGCVHVYFPKDDKIACLPNALLEEKHGFEDNPPEVGNVGSIDYKKDGLWDAIVVGVYSGMISFNIGNESLIYCTQH